MLAVFAARPRDAFASRCECRKVMLSDNAVCRVRHASEVETLGKDPDVPVRVRLADPGPDAVPVFAPGGGVTRVKAFRLQPRLLDRDVPPKMSVHRIRKLPDWQSDALAGAACHLSGGMHAAIGAACKMNWDGLAGNLLERSLQFALNRSRACLTLRSDELTTVVAHPHADDLGSRIVGSLLIRQTRSAPSSRRRHVEAPASRCGYIHHWWPRTAAR